jgi:NADP-dependent 3-hydroxy acid dehydrogenase YdfG
MKKVALITGASSGIGESAAILLHNAGEGILHCNKIQNLHVISLKYE